MPNMVGDLSDRDLALLIWLVIAALFALSRRGGRHGIASILRAFWGKVAVIAAVFAAYIAAGVLVAERIGIWTTGLTKDTVAWYLIPGMALLFGFTRAYEGRRYYGRTILSVIGLTAVVGFYVNLAAFPLWIELLLLPVLVLLGALSAVAGLKPETMVAKRMADGLLGLLGVAMLVGTWAYLVGHSTSFDAVDAAQSFALPVWLTLASLPFIFLFSLYANYETAFVRIDLAAKNDRQTRWRAKAALVTSFHLRNRELHKFTGTGPSELAGATSRSEARRIIAYRRALTHLEEAKERATALRLIRYSGVEGTDWEGRPLDQREFTSTKEALATLAMFHRAQFENGCYRADLMEMVSGLLPKELSANANITMTVGTKGHSWFAWRRTVAGWCIGIGAAGPPPDSWVFEGPEQPEGSPRTGGGWKRGDFDDEGGDL
jgi:hypothetical protein